MTVERHEELIVNTFREEKCFTMSLLLNGIVIIDFDEEFYQINKEHLIKMEEGMEFLGNGKKLPFYINATDFLNVDKEALKYSASPKSGRYTLANAVLVDNSAKKIMYNILLKFKKPHIQTKAFKTKEDAFEWLLSLTDNS